MNETNSIKVLLPKGTSLTIAIVDELGAELDGQFIVDYDRSGNRKLRVFSTMPGNVMGDGGVLYIEDFSKNQCASRQRGGE